MRRQPWRISRCSSACRIPGSSSTGRLGTSGGDRAPGWPSAAAPAARRARVDRRRSELVAERAAQDDGAVDAVGVAEVEDEVAIDVPSVPGAPSTPPAKTARLTSRRLAASARPASSVVWYEFRAANRTARRSPAAGPSPCRRARVSLRRQGPRASIRSGRASASSPARCATPHSPYVPRAAASLKKPGSE